jgi:hypothetical protein
MKRPRIFDVIGSGGWVEDLGHGHSVMVMIPDLIDLDENLDAPIPDRFADLAEELRGEGHDEPGAQDRARGGRHGVQFEPLSQCRLLDGLLPRAAPGGRRGNRDPACRHRHGRCQDHAVSAGNRARLRLHEHFQGPMGFGTPDDAEGWERVQRGARAGDDLWIMLNRGSEAPRVVRSRGIMRAMLVPRSACAPPISSGRG